MRREVIVSTKAVQSFQRILSGIRENSLIGAENTRTHLINAMRKLQLNPENHSRKARFETLSGHYRSILVDAFRVYFKIEETQILVLDIIMEKPSGQI